MNAPSTDLAPTLDTLLDEHRRLDARLRQLELQRSLTAAEQIEYGTLKKQKLLAKDRIVLLQAADRRA
ncbi:MAG: YdcH family protein [Kofleriaceae bacterium]